MQPKVLSKLRRAFEADRVRVTADPRSSQVFVLATARDHEAVRRLLEDDEPPQQDATHSSPWDIRIRQRTPQGPPLPPAAAMTTTTPQGLATRFLPLTSNVREVEQRVVALFGRRLRQSPRGYSLDITSRKTAELAFDTDQRGLHVTADTSILQQLSKLVYALDELGIRSGRRTSVVGIERTDRTQVQRAIDAIREESLAPRESESSAVDRRRLGPLAACSVRRERLAGHGIFGKRRQRT